MAVVWDPVDGIEDKYDPDDEISKNDRKPPANWNFLFNLEILHERSVNYTSKDSSTSNFIRQVGKGFSLFKGGIFRR
jgi:hypothetical protein